MKRTQVETNTRSSVKELRPGYKKTARQVIKFFALCAPFVVRCVEASSRKQTSSPANRESFRNLFAAISKPVQPADGRVLGKVYFKGLKAQKSEQINTLRTVPSRFNSALYQPCSMGRHRD